MRALLIGNSFTARHRMPEMIEHLAAARGRVFEHTLLWAGGASLRRHWNASEAAARIRDGGWDHVVLQEQSTLPVKNATRMLENVALFAPVVQESGARLALYATWARRGSPDAQAAIDAAYAAAALATGAIVIPVGTAWQQHLASGAAPDLYDKDGSHPSLAGSYLAACVFAATLAAVDPDGAEYVPEGLAASDAAVLQRLASRLMR